jgi:hypothetical protein
MYKTAPGGLEVAVADLPARVRAHLEAHPVGLSAQSVARALGVAGKTRVREILEDLAEDGVAAWADRRRHEGDPRLVRLWYPAGAVPPGIGERDAGQAGRTVP